MTSYHIGAKLGRFVVRPQQRTEFCEQKWMAGGKLYQCCAPTNGHTYCKACEMDRREAPCGHRYTSFFGNVA